MKKFVAIIVVFIIAVSAVLYIVHLGSVGSKTLVVPDDYPTIQAAIDSANSGDTIFVKKGIYNESLNIESKSLSLIGEDSKNTIIVGRVSRWGMPPVISLYTFDTLITGFTIRNNNITTDRVPIGGIYLESATKCSIRGNNIINNEYGVYADDSNNIVISGNNITGNPKYGVGFYSSNNNRVSENNISRNGSGVYSFEGENNIIDANNIENNEGDGIWIRLANSFQVYGNNIVEHKENSGIRLSVNTTNFMVCDNNLENNRFGVSCYWHDAGGQAHSAGNFNKVYHNDFLNNSQQVSTVSESIQSWDNGKEGNYWSDYNGTDNNGDGIGDTPYVIDDNNRDNYPLMNPVDTKTIPEHSPEIILPLVITTQLTVTSCKKWVPKN
jgi:nitrous oxidase accessory protein